MKTRRNLLAITALLLLALVQIQTATAASVPRYDPHNEGIFDRITRVRATANVDAGDDGEGTRHVLTDHCPTP